MRDAGDVSRCSAGTERRHPAVIATIETIMRMGASLDAEPDLISVLIQNRLHYRGSDVPGMASESSPVNTGAVRRSCSRSVRGRERTNSVERALVGERCCTLALFDSSAAEILNVIDPTYENRVLAILNLRFSAVSRDFEEGRDSVFGWDV